MRGAEIPVEINRRNVWRIAERIVSNELEGRGFRVSALNKEGQAANADLLASRGGKVWQIQVKGATNDDNYPRWWVQYGFCTVEIIKGKEPMFNRRDSFYRADVVVLVAVKSPREYRCIVLPVGKAIEAADLNLDRGFRGRTKKGTPKKPNKVWVELDRSTGERKQDPRRDKERRILNRYEDAWHALR